MVGILLKNLELFQEIKCRFGCKNPIGIFYVPNGYISWKDPIQALCAQHFITAESEGNIKIIFDLTKILSIDWSKYLKE